MRLTMIAIIASSAAALACGCASTLRTGLAAPSCQRANTYTLAERLGDPCGYADALGECAGLPPEHRLRIHVRCEHERASVGAPPSVDVRRGADLRTDAAGGT